MAKVSARMRTVRILDPSEIERVPDTNSKFLCVIGFLIVLAISIILIIHSVILLKNGFKFIDITPDIFIMFFCVLLEIFLVKRFHNPPLVYVRKKETVL